MRQFGRSITAIVVLGAGFVIALLAGEGFTRVFFPQNVDTVLNILQADPVVGYIYRPGAVANERGREYDVPFVINDLGLRDRDYVETDDEPFRVLLIGNSFAVSHGCSLQNSLGPALERRLNGESKKLGRNGGIQVVNVTNAGYNGYNYWRSYARWKDEFSPDLVLVGFVPSIEHRCDHDDMRYVIQGGLLRTRYREGEEPVIPRRSPVLRVRKVLARNSDLYVLIRNFFYYNETTDRLRGGGRAEDETARHLQPYLVPAPANVRSGLGRAFDFLARLQDETGEDGIPLLVVSIPERAQVQAGYFDHLLAAGEEGGARFDPDQPAELLHGFCRDHGIDLVDPTSHLRQRDLTEPMYFNLDNHWNPRGIDAASAYVVEQWRDLGLPPFEP